MIRPDEMERAITDDLKSGAAAVMNRALERALSTGTSFEKWPAEEQAKYFLILDVEGEVLRRVERTFAKLRSEDART